MRDANTVHRDRLAKACTLIATAECIESCCHNSLSAVSGPHDGASAWPATEGTHPMMTHFIRRQWNDDSPPTLKEIETARALIKESIVELNEWLAEMNG